MKHVVYVPGMIALACAMLNAQPCYAENDGPVFNNAFSMGGPLTLAVRITAPGTVQILAVEVFTGEHTGARSIGIASDAPGLNQPGAVLSQGAFSMRPQNSWQGANLPGVATLVSGQTYWVVWTCLGGEQSAVDVASPTAITQPYRAIVGSATTWGPLFQFPDRPWKIRLYCNPLPYQQDQACSSMNVNGLVGTGSTPATLTTIPFANQTLNFFASTNNPFDIVLTLQSPLIPLFAVTSNLQVVNVDLTSPTLTTVLGATFTIPGTGTPTSVPFALPTPQFQVAAQMIVLDATHPDGFCLSQPNSIQTL